MALEPPTQQAREERQTKRLDDVRERAVEGYLAAVAAVSWLSTMHVEDSVDPQSADDYVPKTEKALANLEEARSALGRVAALGGNRDLASIAQETYSALTVLGDAWTQGSNLSRAGRVRLMLLKPEG